VNCQECLEALSTASITELEQNKPVRLHYSACAECSRVVRLVANGERDLAAVLNGIPSRVVATVTAETAIAVAARKKTARILSIVFAALVVVILWATWMQVIVPSIEVAAELSRSKLITETTELRCISPEQAGDLISPYVRSNGSAYYIVKAPVNTITVRATREEMINVRILLTRFDNGGAVCAVP
jgi:hypothetical protein